MLITRIFEKGKKIFFRILVNQPILIEEIIVWQSKARDRRKKEYEYRILKPSGYETKKIVHRAKKGHRSLLIQVLKLLEEKDQAEK